MVTARQATQFSKRLGKAIAQYRLMRGLTQEQIAARMGVEQETISRFERGATLPSLSRLMDIAEVLNVPMEALLGSSSSRLQDQAVDIAMQLDQLDDEDREWMREWIAQMCQKLASRK